MATQVSHDAFNRTCLMRERFGGLYYGQPMECDNCGGTDARGGLYRYWTENDDSPYATARPGNKFCCVGCYRSYFGLRGTADMTTYRYDCAGMRPIIGNPGMGLRSPVATFAGRIARRMFGRRGVVVQTTLGWWMQDGNTVAHDLVLARRQGGPLDARPVINVRIVITRTEVADRDDYDPGPSEALWQARMGGDMSA